MTDTQLIEALLKLESDYKYLPRYSPTLVDVIRDSRRYQRELHRRIMERMRDE